MNEPTEQDNFEDATDNETDGKIDVEMPDDKDGDKNKNIRKKGKKKKICAKKKWTCESEPLWRVYMNNYLEREKQLEKEDKFDQRKAAVLPRFPNVKSSEQIPPASFYSCFPFNTFNLGDQSRLPDKLKHEEKVRLWKRMQNDSSKETIGVLPEILPDILRTNSGEWPGMWPCTKRDLDGERRHLEKQEKRRRKGLLPCQEDTDEDSNPDEPRDNFADRKELGHARIPATCPNVKKRLLVDRAAGEHPGLVDGDYIVFLFGSGNNDDDGDDKGNRSYANVCLRGLKGMHLVELSNRRARQKTWKFCFYQAVVALLAKTQLRYKFAWSANIDNIYDHAWMLFVHMGSVNVKERIRLDDVTVYNYKYSVELELVHEIKNVAKLKKVGENYVEEDLTKMLELERPELMKTKEEIGWEKPKTRKPPPLHKTTREIEEWFDKLPEIYRNCVFRSSKFSLAFWKDGTFWYLYNPYRCDEFGFWFDEGYACIMKFCTRTSLKRHLMILLLRAYSYEPKSPLNLSGQEEKEDSDDDSSDEESEETSTDSEGTESATSENDTLTLQIFQMIYHCAQIQNVKLLQRRPPAPRTEKIAKKITDNCGADLLMSYDPCSQDKLSGDLIHDDEDENADSMEKPYWLKHLKVTWARFAAAKKRDDQEEDQASKLRWHQYYVEEPHKIFTLWGQIHPTEQIFAKENRGKQTYACYVVCAGMTRIQAPEYWSPKTLDAVVMCGDRFYTLSKLESERVAEDPEFSHVTCWSKYLSRQFKIGETLFEGSVLSPVCGQLYKKCQCLWQAVQQMFIKYHFGILTCESSCLGIFKFCGAYYMLDANSFGPPLFEYGNGVAYLIRATSFFKFMTVLVLTIGSSECSRFSLSPIEIVKVIDLGTTDPRTKKAKPTFRQFECSSENAPKGTRKSKSKGLSERSETIHRVPCKKSTCRN